MLDDMKIHLRVTSDVYDIEVEDLIAAARADMKRVGIIADKVESDDDPLVKMAIASYVKARFGFDNSDMDAFNTTYRRCVADMLNSSDYNTAAMGD